jgi:hypothetical protein
MVSAYGGIEMGGAAAVAAVEDDDMLGLDDL